MSQSEYPDWVRKNPEKYTQRIAHEAKELYMKFPHIGIYRNGDTMYLEGPVVTVSGNQYTVKVVYPERYPFEKPDGFVMDTDVVKFCSNPGNSGHNYHNYGSVGGSGLKLCLMGYQDNVNKGWTPKQTGVTILEYIIMWLHAYEYKRSRGVWPLPE